jgi:hypothetical protein
VSVAEDWVRKLLELPLASVWEAYDKLIEQPGQFAPSLGDFLQRVKAHTETLRRLRLELGR